jgi:predicted RNA binding protein YcfA (HicA-like mRNA interferase family)
MVPRLGPVDCQTLVRFFEDHGFRRERQRGSHLTMVKQGVHRPVVIPMHSDVYPPIILSNLRTAGLSRDDLLAWLERR